MVVAEAPGTNLSLNLGAIKSAKKNLLINIYEFTSKDIKDAIIERIHAGVQVKILEEGQPVGGFSAQARAVKEEIEAEMKQVSSKNLFLVMTSQEGVKRRFRFDHGKYIVIDDKSLLIGSENYSPTGHPAKGAVGNRGWEALLYNAPLAKQFSQIFESDSDTDHGDVIAFLINLFPSNLLTFFSESPWLQVTGPGPLPRINESDLSQEDTSVEPLVSGERLEASDVEKITSPDTSLSGLLSLIENAHEKVDLELMTFDSNWGGPGHVSPLFEAVLAAARRGVEVRVLLNDEKAFSPNNKSVKNSTTVNKLNSYARKERLQLSAAIANLKAMGVRIIHNKGALVDGDKTLISSINWNANSVENNRETAVVLTGRSVFDHYEAIFEQDWQATQ